MTERGPSPASFVTASHVAKDEDSYRYLAESIRKHPDQQALRQLIIEEGGFDEVQVHNLSGGIVALHRAFKY